MGFIQLLKSLDELLYEVMGWLVFYPLTLWRAIRHPRTMMAYADRELHDREDQQYTEALSPPLFLLLTILLSHGIELALIGQSEIVGDKHGLAGLISDDTNLILLRLATFSLFPLVMAARLLRKTHRKLDRTNLRAPFYSQCYPAGPYALAVGLAGTFARMHWDWAAHAALALIGVALVWYWIFQALWFARAREVSFARGAWDATAGMATALVGVGISGALFG